MEENLKSLSLAAIKVEEFLMQENPKFKPSQFEDSARLQALNELYSKDEILKIYGQDNLLSVIQGLYDVYDISIGKEEIDKLMAEAEVEAKLLCLRFYKAQLEELSLQ